MDGLAEVRAQPLAHSGLADDADGQVGRARVRRRRLEGGAGLALGDAGGALQRLGGAIQMTGAITADIDLNAKTGGRRRGPWLRLLSQGRCGRKRQQRKKTGRLDRGYAKAARPHRLAPERA